MRVEGGRPVNGIASELPMQRMGTFITFFWQWKWMSVVTRLKIPIEMHYTVIPLGTSKVNSSHECLEAMREDNHCCCFVVRSDWKTTGHSRHVVVVLKGRTAVSAPPIDARDRCLLLTLGVWNVRYVKYIMFQFVLVTFTDSPTLSFRLSHRKTGQDSRQIVILLTAPL